MTELHSAHNDASCDITRPRAGAASGRPLEATNEPPKPYYDVDPVAGCWNWNRAKGRQGYGTVRYAGQYVGAHRAFFAYYVAPIPAGRVVMHVCDNTSCVNPDHLAMGTVAANQADKRLKGRADTLRGEANGWAKFSSVDVLRIFELRAGGMRVKDIAAEYGTTPTGVSHVLSRLRHASVPVPANLVEAVEAVTNRRKVS